MNHTTFFYNWYFHVRVLSFTTDEQQTKIFLHNKTENAFHKKAEKSIKYFECYRAGSWVLNINKLDSAQQSWLVF